MIDDRRSWLADAHLAFSFLTRLPLPPLAAMPAGGLGGAMRAFPLAGAAVGMAGGLVYALLATPLTPLPAALLAVAAMAWLTGGLHEDGLADTADGFGAERERARRLEIMRDSRIGTFGVLALVIGVGLRVAALAALPALAGALALVAAGALSRAVMPMAMRIVPPARSDGLGFGAGKPSSGGTFTAMALAALVALLCLPPGIAALAVAASVVLAFASSYLAERKIGGYTGDVLGALQQVTEIAVLLLAVAMR